MESPLARHQNPSSEGDAFLSANLPPAGLRVPVTLGHALPELDVLHQVELVRHSLQIVEDLLLPAVYTAPVWVVKKGEAVEV